MKKEDAHLLAKRFVEHITKLGHPIIKGEDIRDVEFVFSSPNLKPLFEWITKTASTEN